MGINIRTQFVLWSCQRNGFVGNLFTAQMELSARESIECLWKIYKLLFWAVDVSGAWKRCLTAWKALHQLNRAIWAATLDNPTYRQVCNGDTGHVEVVRVTFDPAAVTFREILDVFFSIHDPTTLNRQGDDMGTQYRSAIFYSTEEQYREAKRVIDELNAGKHWPNPIVTSLEPAAKFFVAEDYHQEYFATTATSPIASLW